MRLLNFEASPEMIKELHCHKLRSGKTIKLQLNEALELYFKQELSK